VNRGMVSIDKIRGVLFGAAFGDALGAPTEFLDLSAIVTRWPPSGPTDLVGNPARVTDDTQMMLAVGRALVDVVPDARLTEPVLGERLRHRFVEWLESPDNDRAPGQTCLVACEDLARGHSWLKATRRNSKGCGANMRVQPVALLSPTVADVATRSAVAQFQAAVTHGHATALVASDLTACAIRHLAEGGAADSLLSALYDHRNTFRNVYHETWLHSLWERPMVDAPLDYLSRGWDECGAVIEGVAAALPRYEPDEDPCLSTGDGWSADEALATAMLCFLRLSDEPLRVVQRAAATRGDSDSIACLAGSLAGACHGMAAWPVEWAERIEYAEQIASLASALATTDDDL